MMLFLIFLWSEVFNVDMTLVCSPVPTLGEECGSPVQTDYNLSQAHR